MPPSVSPFPLLLGGEAASQTDIPGRVTGSPLGSAEPPSRSGSELLCRLQALVLPGELGPEGGICSGLGADEPPPWNAKSRPPRLADLTASRPASVRE